MKTKLWLLRLLFLVATVIVAALIISSILEGKEISVSNVLTVAAPLTAFVATFIPQVGNKEKKKLEQMAQRYLVRAFDSHPQEKKQFMRGFAFWQQGKHAQAVDCLEKLCKKTEDGAISARAYAQIGRCYLDGKEYPAAIRALEEATTCDPSFALAWSNLATAYDRAGGTPEQSIHALETAIFYDPDYEIAYNKLGMYYSMAGNNERSEWASRTAIRLNPQRPENYSNLAWTLCAMGQADEAEKCYLKALSLGYKDNGTLMQTIRNAKAVAATPKVMQSDSYDDDDHAKDSD